MEGGRSYVYCCSHLRVGQDVAVRFKAPEYIANSDAVGNLCIIEAVRMLVLTTKTRIHLEGIDLTRARFEGLVPNGAFMRNLSEQEVGFMAQSRHLQF